MKCMYCGHKINEGDKFCMECGKPVVKPNPVPGISGGAVPPVQRQTSNNISQPGSEQHKIPETQMPNRQFPNQQMPNQAANANSLSSDSNRQYPNQQMSNQAANANSLSSDSNRQFPNQQIPNQAANANNLSMNSNRQFPNQQIQNQAANANNLSMNSNRQYPNQQMSNQAANANNLSMNSNQQFPNQQMPNQQIPNKKKKGISKGAIAAIILSIIAVILIAGALLVYLFWDNENGFSIKSLFGGSSAGEQADGSEWDDDWGKSKNNKTKNSKSDNNISDDDSDWLNLFGGENEESEEIAENVLETVPVPTAAPTEAPTLPPTAPPTKAPTKAPTVPPTAPPTKAPTEAPTPAPAEKTTNLAVVESSAPVVFKSASASSCHDDIVTDDAHYSYPAQYVIDDNLNSCWCEGGKKEGVGESITLKSDKEGYVKEIEIYNGLCSDKETYYKNNRVRECELKFSDGQSFNITLDGEYENQPCYVKLAVPVKTDSMTLTILSAYPSDDAECTCISEIKVK